MDMMQPAYALSDDALLAQCDVSSSSTHGPGGDHRNKVEAAARLRHRPSGIVAQCESFPQRALNRAQALRRLRVRLAIQDPSPVDPELIARYRADRALHIANESPDYPAVVASGLAALRDAHGRLSDGARALDLTTSQFSRLLLSDKEVLAAANRIRAEGGLGSLHG
jgi:ribosome-associated protein